MVAGIEDYSAAIVIPSMVRAPLLQGGHPVTRGGRLVRHAGGFCVVYPFTVGERRYAVRLWHVPVESVQRNLGTIFSALGKSALPYFLPCRYLPDAIQTAKGPQPAVVMDWTDAVPLKRYIAGHVREAEVLEALAQAFLRMASDLHSAGFSHGDLQHGNILVRPDGSLVLVDYDSMYVPGMKDVPDEIKGLPAYQHPARGEQVYRSAASDRFSELVIYTSIRVLARHPHLWERCRLADSETMLFTEADYQSMGLSDIFRTIEADGALRFLGRAVKDALRERSLDRIIPLEEIVRGQAEPLVTRLSRRWEDSGFRGGAFQSNTDLFRQLAEIATKW